MERFAACAFAHFLQYGMKLSERVEYEFQPMDMGNVMHEALESFAEEVRKRGMKWTELTEQERNEIADRCLDNIVADYGNTVLKSSARNEYMIERTRRILRRTVWALQKQLEQGEFQPEGFEVTFGGGRIDRVDIMEDQNKVYVKVIDYKTGENWEGDEIAEPEGKWADGTEAEPSDTKEQMYILNKNTKKFHKPECSGAKKIKAKNKGEYTGSRQTLIDEGYEPCGNCNP